LLLALSSARHHLSLLAAATMPESNEDRAQTWPPVR
jgi:hypothetical protein